MAFTYKIITGTNGTDADMEQTVETREEAVQSATRYITEFAGLEVSAFTLNESEVDGNTVLEYSREVKLGDKGAGIEIEINANGFAKIDADTESYDEAKEKADRYITEFLGLDLDSVEFNFANNKLVATRKPKLGDKGAGIEIEINANGFAKIDADTESYDVAKEKADRYITEFLGLDLDSVEFNFANNKLVATRKPKLGDKGFIA